jgi:membrane protease YdiL (CAAX protease family)
MATMVPSVAPPDPPELPEGAERQPHWPALFALWGFLVGIGTTLIGATLLAAIVAAFGGKADGTLVTVVGTLVQGFCFAGTAWFFASRIARPRLWHFGVRGARFWPTFGWAVLGIVSFYLITIVYGALVHTDAEQDTVEALGGDQGTFGLILAGSIVIAVAPVVEEFFFRGFFYRALRARFTIVVAALIDGGLFGIIHYSGDGTDGLLILPPLAVLGVLFCLVYERTGTLLAPIGMHAFNNTVAFAVQADDGWKVSVVVGPLFFIALLVAGRRLPRGPLSSPARVGTVSRA